MRNFSCSDASRRDAVKHFRTSGAAGAVGAAARERVEPATLLPPERLINTIVAPVFKT